MNEHIFRLELVRHLFHAGFSDTELRALFKRLDPDFEENIFNYQLKKLRETQVPESLNEKEKVK